MSSVDWNKCCSQVVDQLDGIAANAAQNDNGYAVATAFGSFLCDLSGLVGVFWQPLNETPREVNLQLTPRQLELVAKLARRDDDRRRRQALLKMYAQFGAAAFFHLGSSEAVELRQLLDMEHKRQQDAVETT